MITPSKSDLKKYQGGFTLIELMIVIVIVSILAAVAVPNYQQYVKRSKRSVAKTAMYDVTSRQETYRMDNKGYTADVTDLNFPGAAGATSFWVDSSNKMYANAAAGTIYRITMASGATNVFSLTATAIGSQVADTHCATFTLNESGVKGGTHADCW